MNGREMDGGHFVLQNLETQEKKDLSLLDISILLLILMLRV